MDSILSQSETYVDAKASADWSEKYEKGLRDLETLEKRPLEGVLVRNSIRVQHEPAEKMVEEQRSWLDLR